MQKVNLKGAKICLLFTIKRKPFLRLYKQHNPQFAELIGDEDYLDCNIHHPDMFFIVEENDVVYKKINGKNVVDIDYD